MTQMFVSLPSGGAASGSGPKAVAPVVFQESLIIAVGAGATAQDLLPAIAAGSCAADAGVLNNRGCSAVRATVSYIDNGGDCDGDGCSDSGAAALTIKDIPIDIPANSAFPLPAGLIKQIKVATIDALGGAPFANTSENSLFWYSSYQPGCACVTIP